jgi:hypothetical protein
MTSLHLPARLTGLKVPWRMARPTAAIGPFPAGDGRLNPPSPQSMPEVSAVIALIGTQAGRPLLGAALRSGHPHPVYHLQPHRNFRDISRCHQEGQGQALAFRHQVDRAAFAFPAIGNVLSPCMFDGGLMFIEHGPSELADRSPLGPPRP